MHIGDVFFFFTFSLFSPNDLRYLMCHKIQLLFFSPCVCVYNCVYACFSLCEYRQVLFNMGFIFHNKMVTLLCVCAYGVLNENSVKMLIHILYKNMVSLQCGCACGFSNVN